MALLIFVQKYFRIANLTIALYISDSRHHLGWLPFNLLVQYRALIMMYHHYINHTPISFEPPLELNPANNLCETHTPAFAKFFVTTLVLANVFSRCKATMWWNSLPSVLFTQSGDFLHTLYGHLDLVNFFSCFTL